MGARYPRSHQAMTVTGPLALAGEPDVRDADLDPWTQAQIAERKQPIVFVKLSILGSPADVAQVQGLQSGLEFDPIELAITQEYCLAIFSKMVCNWESRSR